MREILLQPERSGKTSEEKNNDEAKRGFLYPHFATADLINLFLQILFLSLYLYLKILH